MTKKPFLVHAAQPLLFPKQPFQFHRDNAAGPPVERAIQLVLVR
ncbi:hypothetical protein [Corallococcus carmarthensis]|nr:hypothetical protein [Corallococcus carmarthensis]